MYRIVSFNLRYDTPHDGPQQFPNRLPFILETLRRKSPDVIGFQEALQHMRESLRDALPEYDFAGGGRDEDRFGECSLVAFRRDKFNLNECMTFWLSPTPDLPGSRFPEDQSDCPRACTMVSLTDTGNGKTFAVYNLHTDHEGKIARLRASKELLERIAQDTKRRDLPFVMTGDFNAGPESEEIGLLLGAGLRDLAAGSGPTFHNYGRENPPANWKIDYIFAPESVTCAGYRLWKEKKGELFLSDHYPVAAEVEF